MTMRLGEYLCEEGFIQKDQLDEVLELQKVEKVKLGQLLLGRGFIDEDRLTETLARMFQLPYVRLDDIKLDEKAVRCVSHEVLENYKIFPITLKDDCLTVATNDPLNIPALQEIQYKSGYTIKPVMARSSDINEHLREFVDSIHTLKAIRSVKGDGIGGDSVVQLVDSILERAIQEGASDIHFQPQPDRLRLRYRIDGILHEKKPVPKEIERNVLSRIKVLAGMDIAENRRPQDGRASLTQNKEDYDLRLSTIPDIHGENLVLRILQKKFSHRSFESLGMDREEVAVMDRLIHRPHGIMLVTGPTGAGKTTTLYSALNILNQNTKNIISIEDPVEYEMPGITQTAIHAQTGYTFANAMRHILRHDPDIIMVGEIRDVETADMAIRAALTGHLVLSTIHTNTAAGAITRLLEMHIEPFLISSAVSGVISQRLVRKLCPSCLKEYVPTEEILKHFHELKEEKITTLGQAVGCEKCLHTGYQGRIGIFEILEVDDEIKAMILRSETEGDIAQRAHAEGMKSIRMAGLHKVIQRITTLEEVMRVVSLG